ncbi:MAG TPA: hypothetical protein VFV46_00550 [Lacibacter sp.]|nr:hypothetical protein [Lacibacter sp.]
MTANEIKPKELNPVIFRIFYGAFLVFGLYFFVKGDVLTAASNLGIGLIFDPFHGPWQQRKTWQKAWLLVHLTFVFALFGYGIWA